MPDPIVVGAWPARHPLPGPLPPRRFEEFLDSSGDRYDVRLEREQSTAIAA